MDNRELTKEDIETMICLVPCPNCKTDNEFDGQPEKGHFGCWKCGYQCDEDCKERNHIHI